MRIFASLLLLASPILPITNNIANRSAFRFYERLRRAERSKAHEALTDNFPFSNDRERARACAQHAKSSYMHMLLM